MRFDTEEFKQRAKDDYEAAWHAGPSVLTPPSVERTYPRLAYRRAAAHPVFATIQKLRETYLARGFDEAENPIGSAQALEGLDLLVDPVGLRRGHRADDDLHGGGLQRLGQLVAEVGGAGKLLAVAKHRRQATRHPAHFRLPPHQALGNAIILQGAVQPARPFLIGVTVAYEGLVLVILPVDH